MIQLTVERISGLVDIEDVYVATNRAYKELVQQQLPGIPEENILLEPVGRNTAPCIGLGAEHIAKKYDDAVMLVLPSDHLIKMTDVFEQVLKSAAQVAQDGGKPRDHRHHSGLSRDGIWLYSVRRLFKKRRCL